MNSITQFEVCSTELELMKDCYLKFSLLQRILRGQKERGVYRRYKPPYVVNLMYKADRVMYKKRVLNVDSCILEKFDK